MKTFNENGFSSLAAAGIMAILSIFGFSIVSLVTSSKATEVDQLLYDRAFYVTQAGMEYGMRKIYEGASPVVTSPGITFGPGSFTISQVGRVVTVTGTSETSQVIHSVTSPSHADCTEFDVTNARWQDNGQRLSGINLHKICLAQTILDKIIISWTNPGSEGMTQLRVNNQTLYNNPKVLSGILTELADFIMNGNNNNNMDHTEFTSNMNGKTMTMSFIMGDGSAKSTTFTPQLED